MQEKQTSLNVSPRIGALLADVTETPVLETALWKFLSDYIELKIHSLEERIHQFETKWDMSFEEFNGRIEADTLEQDPYSYEVERDFWEWEQAETLLQHYQTLEKKWM